MSGLSSTSTWGSGDGAAAPGGRRKKVYGYLKAANELRQAYTSQWSGQGNGTNEDYYNTPGAFPDVAIARSGDEEMVLFPSYARRLPEKQREERERRNSWSDTLDEYRGASDSNDFFNSGYDESEMENAVVDVDVRGWIYAPNRGPMNRKHRLMITLARKLSGIPAPTGTGNEDADRPPGQGEDELVDKQMQSLVDTAEKDADPAWKSSSGGDRPRGTTAPSQPMSKDELSVANAHLMERLRPFLTNPMALMPVTVFFFNDEQSKSRNIVTDESGHFTLRAPLPFVPTHVRVLASEDLSAAKPIEIIDPVGISLISDIDDTVKHSAIASGAKEMFRNTFVRELAELTIDGVSDWYTKVANQGVKMHYVSNAPWQLYPLLERYFKMVGLPPGSFHLKQYSGMLQGIFEPTAERKRGSLEQLLRDFPDRKFILVGDSGEADLEVYTDIALANRGRILGIFIRDVTTPDNKQFFDRSASRLEPESLRSRSTPQLVDRSRSPAPPPALPPRRSLASTKEDDIKSFDTGDLIDLSDDTDQKPTIHDVTTTGNARVPPAKPSKPSALRSVSTVMDATETTTKPPLPYRDPVRRKPVPPLPPRRPSSAMTDSLIDIDSKPSVTRTRTEPAPGDLIPSHNNALSSSQNPPSQTPGSKEPPPVPPPRRANAASSTASSSSSATPTPRPPATKASYPTAAAQAALNYATERLNLNSSSSNGLRPSASNQSLGRTTPPSNSSAASEAGVPAAPLPNKREELWKRRWERASDILNKQGVVLSSWRVGSDAQSVCMWLVEEAMREMPSDRSDRS
ncbi:hypothetical protein N7474_007639 [Penicillium riverlandense]|uniref:uncharacterized protein n=1 Tax=Penicillium riverlandense TaxID=1903569 RepID=UPI002549A27A|nr:uncharacterized protein N7474_007639 [Penicillium riverlandense]KAJ5811338.1 hypothetical protein N7474_007639 [Penicillium riverlandense]